MTVDRSTPATSPASHWDPLKERLQLFRAGVGNPSYAAITERVVAARVARGMDPHAARVGRTTVYDVFQLGKARTNLDLLREVAATLGATEEQVESWMEACHRIPEELQPPAPGPAPARSHRVLLMVVAVGMNLFGRLLTDVLDLPIYLDMMGTAVAAVALGPWHGALVGASTNGLGHLADPDAHLAFGLVNVLGALVWGYGVRRFRMGTSVPRFFALNCLAAAACSLLAVPIIVTLIGHDLRPGHDSVVLKFQDYGANLVLAVGVANILQSLCDKLLSGFVALAFLALLPATFRRHLPIAGADPRRDPGPTRSRTLPRAPGRGPRPS